MKLNTPENINYAATVATVKAITKLEGRDNIVGTPFFGMQAIVGKDTKVGDIGIVFPMETQLSEEFARLNNLHDHGNLNDDEGVSGYLGDNRRIRAIRLGGHRSDCLFMPLTSLSYIKDKDFNVNDLKEGDVFDVLGKHAICKKYLKPTTSRNVLEKNKDKRFVRVDKKFLPEHYDSAHFLREVEKIPPETRVIVTQKLHGTSIRIGNTIVARQLNFKEKVAKRIGVKVAESEFAHISGSRKVIKDPNNPNQNHFYSEDIWTKYGKKLEGILPENFIVYAELIGWTEDGVPIQKGYTYQVPEKTADMYIYRVALVNGQGRIVDLSWEQVKEFCRDNALKYVPELWTGTVSELTKVTNPKRKEGEPEILAIQDWFLDKHFEEFGWEGVKPGMHAVPLAKESPCDEGVCVRVDGLAPYILKAKSPLYNLHETKMADEEATDLEEEGSVA
jgi:hypothetical protein